MFLLKRQKARWLVFTVNLTGLESPWKHTFECVYDVFQKSSTEQEIPPLNIWAAPARVLGGG